MNLKATIHAFTSGTTSDGSSLTHPPHLITDTPKVRDIVKKRLVHDPLALVHKELNAYKEESQKDNAAFEGKPFRTQDTHYGHYIGEYDTEEDAQRAALARPYTRVLKHKEPNQLQENRNKSAKKAMILNPDEVR